MPEHLVIVGGLAGGLTAAAWARRQSPNLRITVVERGSEISYSECGLPYVLSGEVGSFDRLIRYSPERFSDAYNVKLLTGCTAEELNPQQCRLDIVSASGDSDKLYYDQLILATGARPALPALNTQVQGVFALRHLHEARAIEGYLTAVRPATAVIVGAGWLGLEMAEALTQRGLKVTLLERSSLLAGFNGAIRESIAEELNQRGVTLYSETELLHLEGSPTVKKVHTRSGSINAELVILATGVKPAVELARQAGLRLGATGAIAVSESQRTSYPNVYAAGDCAEVFHLLLNRAVYLPLGTTANKQGRVAGINAAGGRAEFKGVVGTSALKVFSLEVATTGISLEEALSAGFKARSFTSKSVSRAGYYPGSEQIILELVYDEVTGRLLGCRMSGRDAVVKRIDAVATALYNRMRLEDLLQLDLAYAPPFAPVWEPLLYAARKLV